MASSQTLNLSEGVLELDRAQSTTLAISNAPFQGAKLLLEITSLRGHIQVTSLLEDGTDDPDQTGYDLVSQQMSKLSGDTSSHNLVTANNIPACFTGYGFKVKSDSAAKVAVSTAKFRITTIN